MCLICGWIYDEALGDPEHGLAPGTAWAEVSMIWTISKSSLRAPHSGQVQFIDTSAQAVPGAMPCSGSPTASS